MRVQEVDQDSDVSLTAWVNKHDIFSSTTVCNKAVTQHGTVDFKSTRRQCFHAGWSVSTHRWTFSHQSHTRPVMWNQLTTNLGPRDSRKKRVCLGSARLASLLLPWQWPQPERGALEILLVFFVFFPLSLLSLLLPSNLSLQDTPLLFTSLISYTPLASHPLPFISPFPPVNLFNSYSFSMKYHRLILLTPSLLILPPSLPLPPLLLPSPQSPRDPWLSNQIWNVPLLT